MKCSCREKNLRLLSEIQRLTGELILAEHAVRNVTMKDIPESVQLQIQERHVENIIQTTRNYLSENGYTEKEINAILDTIKSV